MKMSFHNEIAILSRKEAAGEESAFCSTAGKKKPEVPLQLSAGIQTASGSLLREPRVPRKAISHGVALFVPAPLDVF